MGFDINSARPVQIQSDGGFNLSTAVPVEQSKQEQPLSFMERTKYSFGDEQGRKGYLEEKYPNRNIRQLPNGKFSVNGVPVDPEGFDLGDIADVTDEIVRLGFQLKGASEGAAAGVAAGSPGALF